MNPRFLRHEQPHLTPQGLKVALCFALVAQHLSTFFEHNHHLTHKEGAMLLDTWLQRGTHRLPYEVRSAVSTVSHDLAKEIIGSVSREAGLYISHELNEALDPNHVSEIAENILAECATRV